MEAWRFGFDPSLPPAFKFDPTDADLVAHYLLPRALGLQTPHAHAVIDDDPASCPPWELIRRHGHAGSDHAFFFAPPRDPNKKERASRVVPPGTDSGVAGTWRGQKGQEEELFLLRGAGAAGDIVVKYKKYNLTYYNDGDDKKTSGWVMNEYQIVDPPLLPGDVLARVKITDRANKARRKQQKTADDAQKSVTSYHGEPGPSGSSYYHVHGQQAAGNAFFMTRDEASGSAQAVVAVQQEDCDGAEMGVPVVNCDTKFLHSREGIECYVEDNNNNNYMETMNNHFNRPYGANNVNYEGGRNSYYCHNDSSDMKHETDDGYCG